MAVLRSLEPSRPQSRRLNASTVPICHPRPEGFLASHQLSVYLERLKKLEVWSQQGGGGGRGGGGSSNSSTTREELTSTMHRKAGRKQRHCHQTFLCLGFGKNVPPTFRMSLSSSIKPLLGVANPIDSRSNQVGS